MQAWQQARHVPTAAARPAHLRVVHPPSLGGPALAVGATSLRLRFSNWCPPNGGGAWAGLAGTPMSIAVLSMRNSHRRASSSKGKGSFIWQSGFCSQKPAGQLRAGSVVRCAAPAQCCTQPPGALAQWDGYRCATLLKQSSLITTAESKVPTAGPYLAGQQRDTSEDTVHTPCSACKTAAFCLCKVHWQSGIARARPWWPPSPVTLPWHDGSSALTRTPGTL